MDIQKININNLIEAKYNPRKDLKPGDNEYEKIKKSIEKFGYVEPLIVNCKNNNYFKIISGHQRYKVLKYLGYKEIHCILVNLDEKDEKTLNIALNKIAGEWDNEKLYELLKNFEKDDFLMTGFDDNEFEDLEMEFSQDQSINKNVRSDNFNEEEAKEEAKKNLITKPGYFYQLGNHYLLCGDSFKENDRNKLINNKFMDMIYTDPPYNMQMGGQGCFKDSTKKIKKRIDKLINFDVTKLSFLPNIDIGSFYIFTSKNGIRDYLKIFEKHNFNILVWGKTNAIPYTSGTFIPDLEYILYFSTDKKIWNNSLKPAEIYKKYYISSISEAKKEDGDLHPTMKPIELISNRLRISSNENSNILDLFAGSGSTMIACEQLNRNCYMMEVEPVYCDVIIQRYIKFRSGKSDDVFLINKDKKTLWSKLVGGNNG